MSSESGDEKSGLSEQNPETSDTHATILELQSKGFDAQQAEAIVFVVSRSDSGLVTKADREGNCCDERPD